MQQIDPKGLENVGGDDIKRLISIIGKQLNTKEIEIIKLKLTKEFELRIKDIEKSS